MKKIALSILVVLALAVVSCGPSQSEIAEKAKADSIKLADSITLVNTKAKIVADSIAKADSKKAEADSIAKISVKKEVKKAKKGKK